MSYGAKIAARSTVEGRLPMCIDALGSVLEGRPRGEGADLFRIPAWKAATTSDRPRRWQGRGTIKWSWYQRGGLEYHEGKKHKNVVGAA